MPIICKKETKIDDIRPLPSFLKKSLKACLIYRLHKNESFIFHVTCLFCFSDLSFAFLRILSQILVFYHFFFVTSKSFKILSVSIISLDRSVYSQTHTHFLPSQGQDQKASFYLSFFLCLFHVERPGKKNPHSYFYLETHTCAHKWQSDQTSDVQVLLFVRSGFKQSRVDRTRLGQHVNLVLESGNIFKN